MLKNRMPQALKEQWLNALRSGNYIQGTAWLFNPKDTSYCCLGVLEHAIDGEVEMISESCSFALPSQVWAEKHGIEFNGKSQEDFLVWPLLYYQRKLTSAFTLNDEFGLTFNEIADLIEDQIEGY
jgi:hypothetical protein